MKSCKSFAKLLIILLYLGCVEPALASETLISGGARVVDGDTLEIDNTKIRLAGIDAPESGQVCGSAGASVYCGQQATYELEAFIDRDRVDCIASGSDRYRRLLAVCSVRGENINQWLVSNGWALAYRKYSNSYVQAETEAQDNGLGIWKYEFIEPWNWRSAQRTYDRAE